MILNDQVQKYWKTIHWDATSFLTLHESRNSRLFYDKICPSVVQDLMLGLRGILAGIIRLLQGAIRSLVKRSHETMSPRQQYLLLITIGTAKYASEEREIVDACMRNGLGVLTIYTAHDVDISANGQSLSLASVLTACDYIGVMANWLWEILCRLPCLFSRDRKKRSLFVASIPAIRVYYLYMSFTKKIVACRGLPHLAFSLLPGSAISVAVVIYLKNRGVLTAGIRTQATSCEPEHVAINTDILFCKSSQEIRNYEEIFTTSGPRLEEGCLLSLPEIYELELPSLPDKFVLLLGTAPGSDQHNADYRKFKEKLFQVASQFDMPIVYKGHNLAKDFDDEWFANKGAGKNNYLRITDIRYNRLLIDRASLVVSVSSTLLYYTILSSKPMIIVHTRTDSSIPDEFQSSPIKRIAWHQDPSMEHFDLKTLRDSVQVTREWFNNNYFLQKGPDYMINFLLREPTFASGTKQRCNSGSQSRGECVRES